MKSLIVLLITISVSLTGTSQQAIFKYNVHGCAAGNNLSKNKNAAPENTQAAWQDTLLLRGDSLVYQRTEEHMCCRKVKLNYEIKKGVITITEYWDGMGCKCRCSSSVEAVLKKIPAGTYHVKILATGTDPVTNKPTNGSEIIMEKKILVN
ncbi:MAG: hypothetical protein QM725_04095 [Lacibacter sp.]